MKHFHLLLLCLSLVFLCACGSTSIQATPAVTEAPATAAPDPGDRDQSQRPPLDEEEPAAASATDLRPQAEDSSTDTASVLSTYESDLGFCLRIPDSWQSAAAGGSGQQMLFAAEEGENAVRFYDSANAEAGFGGTLVTIRLFAPGEDYLYLPDFELLAETDAGSYVAIYPTDLQADPGSDELLTRYLAMTAELQSDLTEGFELK